MVAARKPRRALPIGLSDRETAAGSSHHDDAGGSAGHRSVTRRPRAGAASPTDHRLARTIARPIKEQPMPAYHLAEQITTDPAMFEEYRVKLGPMIAKHGGRYLTKGG